MLGRIEGGRRRGWQRMKMVGWHHRHNGHGLGWTPGVGDGQESLVRCSPWGRKESDTTEWLNWTERHRFLWDFAMLFQSLSHVSLLFDPMNCSPPGSSVHGISQTETLKWVAISSSRGPFRLRDWTHISWIGRWSLYHWATKEAQVLIVQPFKTSYQLQRLVDYYLAVWKPVSPGSLLY